MRLKSIPLHQYQREHKALDRHLDKGSVDAYVLTHRGKKTNYVMTLEVYLAGKRRQDLRDTFAALRQRLQEREHEAGAVEEDSRDS